MPPVDSILTVAEPILVVQLSVLHAIKYSCERQRRPVGQRHRQPSEPCLPRGIRCSIDRPRHLCRGRIIAVATIVHASGHNACGTARSGSDAPRQTPAVQHGPSGIQSGIPHRIVTGRAVRVIPCPPDGQAHNPPVRREFHGLPPLILQSERITAIYKRCQIRIGEMRASGLKCVCRHDRAYNLGA